MCDEGFAISHHLFMKFLFLTLFSFHIIKIIRVAHHYIIRELHVITSWISETVLMMHVVAGEGEGELC